MANGKELINYKNALEEALKAQFNNMTIIVFDDMDENSSLPAIVVDKPVLETTFQNVATKTNFTTTMIVSVYVVYSAAEENSNINSIQTSANVAKFIHGALFNLRTPAKVTEIEPVVVAGLEAFDIQKIGFEQNISIISDQ